VDVLARQALQRQMVRLSQGDRTAFAPVFAALWPLLRGLCARLLGDTALAEDVAQTALCKIFARADELDPGRDAVAWAVGVAVWECRTQRKQRARRRERPIDGAEALVAESGRGPDAAAEEQELFEAVRALWGELRPADAEVLEALLRGEPPAIPSATFRKRVQRAVGRLREIWRARHGV